MNRNITYGIFSVLLSIAFLLPAVGISLIEHQCKTRSTTDFLLNTGSGECCSSATDHCYQSNEIDAHSCCAPEKEISTENHKDCCSKRYFLVKYTSPFHPAHQHQVGIPEKDFKQPFLSLSISTCDGLTSTHPASYAHGPPGKSVDKPSFLINRVFRL
ncbi:MAG: hypothetical protein FJY10_09255 [Bacteroidetes bacterium]|nr:hypothetical protein [Bacteroidota bacterium]